MTGFTNPDASAIRAMLLRARRVAVVGLSPRPDRPSHQVAAALQRYGYEVVPVRPAVDRILGEVAYPDLYQVPGPVDLVDVFRAPAQMEGIVDACIALKVPVLWLQDGVVNEPAARRAAQAGIFTVMDRCLYRDYRDLVGAARGDRAGDRA